MAVDTGDKVTRKYANFRGVDFRGEECSLNRSPDALNVWRNYKKLSSIETRPGLDIFYNPTQGVRSIRWHGGKFYYIGRDDNKLHEWNKDTKIDTELCDVNDGGFFFEFEGKLYVNMGCLGKATNEYGDTMDTCIYNASDKKFVAPFIPTTSIKKTMSGGGETYQDVNMLSSYRINTFRGDDGESAPILYLDAEDLDEETPEVKIDGIDIVKYYKDNYKQDVSIMFNAAAGTVSLEGVTKLPAPKTAGQDNISVKFKKTNAEYQNKIMRCTMAQEFDNRVFFSGNPAYPNVVWHSSLSDPSYISDLDYYEDGKDAAPIRSLVAGNNALWVFRDTETTNGVYYHVPTLDSDYGKVYPSSHSSISLGCAGRAINFGDDIVFFSSRGMESASTDITTEQFATHKSSMVDRKMITNKKYKDMVLAEWNGYLLVFIGNEVYLADSRAVLTNENHYEYEWYYWTLGNYNVTCATVHDGVLYVGTEREIYAFDEALKDGIESYWTTPKDKFGAANKLKTTNKKGCVVEATGNVDIYAKVEDTDFELIGTNKDVDDYFVSRIKRKKFKDIQLKFQSQTNFCLESATLECFVGGYIKR
jgi:hypothetical protein